MPMVNAIRSRGWWSAALLAAAVSVDASGVEERLLQAIRQQDAAAVRALLRGGADVNAVEVDGMTPLHWAVQLDDRALAEMLIHAGARVTAATRYGVTPLTM